MIVRGRRRRHSASRASAALSLATCIAMVTPAATAQAERAWQAPTTLASGITAGHWSAGWDTTVAVTSQGDAIATFARPTGTGPYDDEVVLVTQTAAGAIEGPEPLEASASGPVRLAADGIGNAYVVYLGSGGARIRMRPPGGTFGPAETLSTGGAVPLLVPSPDGNLAAVWPEGGDLKVAFRPVNGAFGAPELLLGAASHGSPYLGGLAGAFSKNGELAVGVSTYSDRTDPNAAPSRMFGLVRRTNGATTVKQLSSGPWNATDPSIGIDDAGRAVLAWSERDPSHIRAVHIAQRSDGPAFEDASVLARFSEGLYIPWPAEVVVGGNGAYTLAYTSRHGVRVVTGRTGAASHRLRSFYHSSSEYLAGLVASPSGSHTILFRDVQGHHPVTTAREGDLPFGRSQDVLTDCGRAQYMRLAVGDLGHAAAIVRRDGHALLVTDAPGSGIQTCVPTLYPEHNPSLYDDDPYAPRTSGGPGGGDWEDAGDGTGTGNVQPPPLPIVVGSPTLRAASGRTRHARVVVSCAKPCRITASAKLHFDRGEALGTGRRRRSSRGKATVLEIPIRLSAAAERRLDRALKKGGKRPLLLTFRVSAAGSKLKKQTREVTTVLGPSTFF